MDVVGAGFGGFGDLLAQAGEIGGEDGWGELYLRITPLLAPSSFLAAARALATCLGAVPPTDIPGGERRFHRDREDIFCE